MSNRMSVSVISHHFDHYHFLNLESAGPKFYTGNHVVTQNNKCLL